jgi:luciferase family oxidoreductase group 1
LKLSVIDQSPVSAGMTPAEALGNSIELARLADRLGYERYWIAEHHAITALASPAPEILMTRIAAETSGIRVGSGGVMLPHYSALKVAEVFRMLHAMYPDRIDLGIGRAPGTDPVTSYALRARQEVRADDDFLERFQELMLWESGGFPANHPFRNVRAMPADVPLPPVWLLGSSDYSAELSAAIGAGFAFAHHFASYDAVAALTSYRARFRPSAWRKEPYGILAVAVVCADSDAEAERLALTVDLNYVRRSKGEYLPLASPQEAAAYSFTDADRRHISRNRARVFVGSSETVRARLMPLIEASQADEVMITSAIYDHAARKHSYELMAQAFGLKP